MIRWLALWLLLALPVAAQDFSGLARVEMPRSSVRDAGRGAEIVLGLTQPVPWRVFTLDDPRRLVIDFREVDWRGVSRAALLNADRITDLRFGPLRPGWSRMVADLAAPMAVQSAGMQVDAGDGRATLTIRLTRAEVADFAAGAGAPPDPDWAGLLAADATMPAPTPVDGPLTVMIDPGHGGIDPGAERGGLQEADLMLRLGIELADALNRTGRVRALLTRQSDIFVPLSTRITLARAARADLLISLHADALEQDAARGASIYTLSEAGEDSAAQRMAERHERGDLLAGVDLSGQEDRVATVLMELARRDSGPASARLADRLVTALRGTGAAVNNRPRRAAFLAVLTAADFPSVLVEAGFLSNAEDRARLASDEGRAPIVAAITGAILDWAADEAALAPLKRR